MIEVKEVLILPTHSAWTPFYDVLVDGQSVARYPSRDEAEAHAERLRKEAGDANGG